MWVAESEADVASDLSAFHRIDDPMTIDGPRYFSLAVRLGAYLGVVAARAAEHRAAEQGRDTAPVAAPRSAATAPQQPTRQSDTALLATLAAEGWAEHVVEEGTG